MRAELLPYTPALLEPWRALLAEPSIAPQFEAFQGVHALEHKLADSHLPEDGIRLAFVDGEPAGFGFAWILGGSEAPWAMLRVAVHPRFRRRGLGRALAAALSDVVAARGSLERFTSYWLPAAEGERFAAALGFEHERWFWMMERPRGDLPPPAWPEGIEVRVFDRSEAMLRDWNDAYNGSFIDHWRYVPSSLEDARRIAEAPGFRAEGLALAYRGREAVGFCRCELYPARGEIGVLGTTRAARGLGLGRALLRWGVAWLEAHTEAPITLVVEGENERALPLYRSEGFAIIRTRQVLRSASPR